MAGLNDAKNKSESKTITETLTGTHQHVVVGYTLVRGIGDGEPIASERFSVGGHEWVLLFYPDGKRSSAAENHIPNEAAAPQPPPQPQGAGRGGAIEDLDGGGGDLRHVVPAQPPPPPPQQQRRDTTNEYAALFVALIGEGPSPQGIVNTSEGKVVRAFHRFTLVDQLGQGRDLSKGRTRDAGAVKISCARQDPNARNCHGYRKFVKRSILEDPTKGYLVNDTIVIKYTIELVVSTGGALSRSHGPSSKSELIKVPPSNIGVDLGRLFASGQGVDYMFEVEGEEMGVHKIILEARSPVFRALINTPMREGHGGKVLIHDIKAEVFRVLLHYVYTDSLPDEHADSNLEVAMAQHLLVASDRFELIRLRRICERRLCESVDVETVATTLTLAEQNHADELKKVCLDFVSRHLGSVMQTDGYRHMTTSCPQLQGEVLQTMAAMNGGGGMGGGHYHGSHHHGGGASVVGMGGHRGITRPPPMSDDREVLRRVRPRLE